MKTKYLISALVAGAMGSGLALAETDEALGMSNNADTAASTGMSSSSTGSYSTYGEHKSRAEVQSEAARDLRANGAGTGEGYSAEQMREGRGDGSASDYRAAKQWHEEPEPSVIGPMGDGTAKP